MTYDCTKCKRFGKQTCVPNGFSCTYEPILPTLDRQTIKLRKLEKENEQLKNRIDKAIEYIEETTKRNDELNCTKLLAVNQVEQLLEILKGKSE